ncbi:MAG: glycosyltransferase [Candidatus Woesearchaeota archaeon]
MRIGFFTETYRPVKSGVVTSLIAFKQELESKKHKVYVFAPKHGHYKDREKNIIRFNGLKILNTDFSLTFPMMSPKLRICKNLDVIHANHPVNTGLTALYVARLYKKPLIFTAHSNYEDYDIYLNLFPKLSKKLIRTYIKSFLEFFDYIIVPSKRMRNHFLRMKLSKPVVIIPTGINLKEFNLAKYKKSSTVLRNKIIADFRIKKADFKKTRILLYAGRLAKEKNLPLLLKLMKRIELDNVVLVIVGNGPEKDFLEDQIAKNDLQNRIRIYPATKDYKALIPYYKAADVFATPSKQEAQGLTILESMASETPVVCFKNFGTSDFMIDGFNGLVAKNDSDFIRKIELLINDNELRQKILSNAFKTAEKYSIEKCAKKLLVVYERAIFEKKKRDNGDFMKEFAFFLRAIKKGVQQLVKE